MEENKKEKEKKINGKLGIIIMVISVIILGIGIGLFFAMPNNGNKSNKEFDDNTETDTDIEAQFDIDRLYYALHIDKNETSGKSIEQKIYSQHTTNVSELTGDELSQIIYNNTKSSIDELIIDDSQLILEIRDGDFVYNIEYEYMLPYHEANEIFKKYVQSIFGNNLQFNDSLLESVSGIGFTLFNEYNYAFHKGINIGKKRYSYNFDRMERKGKKVIVYENVKEYEINVDTSTSNPSNQYVYKWIYELNNDGNYYLLKIERVD